MSEPIVRLREDVVFASVGERDLHCDIFTPEDATSEMPAIVLVHGGAWKLGDRKQLRGYGYLFARKGFICVATEYRLSGESKWPAPVDDLNRLLDWLTANGSRLGIDTQRIALLGHSSGAHLGIVAAGMRRADPTLHQVAALISFYAPTSLVPGASMLRSFVDEFLGEAATSETYAAASPESYVTAGLPPTLLFHSNTDNIVPRLQSLSLYEKLLAAGTPAEIHMFDRVPHAFDADKSLSRLALAISVNFLERFMPPRAPG